MRTSRRLGPRPGSGYDPRAAHPATACGCAHARRHLGPCTGQECCPRAPRPGLAGGFAHAQRRLSKRPRAGISPQGLLSQLPRPKVGQRGRGEVASRCGDLRGAGFKPGAPFRLPAPSPLPLPHRRPEPHPLGLSGRRYCSVGGPAQRPAGASPRSSRASAGCARMPDRGGKRRGADPRGGEGRGPGDGASPLLPAAPLPPPPPFSPVNGPLGLGTGYPRCVHLSPFLRDSPVDTPHLLQASGPQSLAISEMPEPQG